MGVEESKIPGYPLARDWFYQFVSDQYEELDMADGDLKLDLNADLAELGGRYQTVVNLGTIEHVWNVHTAYCNALRAVAVDGHFLCHAPVGGWQDEAGCMNHGLHQTRADGIANFVEKNGFKVVDTRITQWRSRGRILWLRAAKERHVEALADFKPIYRLRGLSVAGYTWS